jgi:hypothetical protein
MPPLKGYNRRRRSSIHQEYLAPYEDRLNKMLKDNQKQKSHQTEENSIKTFVKPNITPEDRIKMMKI